MNQLKVCTAHLNLHVAELADLAEAAILLPQAAHHLAAHCGIAVSERAAVALPHKTQNLETLKKAQEYYSLYYELWKLLKPVD